MEIKIASSINTVSATQWNRLVGDLHPFLRFEFLHALENNGCAAPQWGWTPCHFMLFDQQQQLCGAMPAYLKDNSYGEFVFDWAWADAYERAGLSYYPKLVCSIPYTPATSRRLLHAPDADPTQVRNALVQTAIQFCEAQQLSSAHWLFPPLDETEHLEQFHCLRRTGAQYHWNNKQYADFEDYLSHFSSKKRKNVRRERRRIAEQDIEIVVKLGSELNEQEWQQVAYFYRITFDKKWGQATLNLDFFQEIGHSMGEQIVLFLAYREHQPIACAINFRSNNTLYGRHWGCSETLDSLHFELCYYQGIEYCIREGLQSFEPGAQGEYKISRGFVPTPTYSTHWIANAKFRHAIVQFLDHETDAMKDYMDELDQHVPFRQVS